MWKTSEQEIAHQDRPDGRSLRRKHTETTIISVATRLFLQAGYTATSLATVAQKARISERTLYVHFPSKVALFQRVIEVGIVGDADQAPLPERPWSIQAFNAPSAAERITAFADGVAEMNKRLGPLMAVNAEVEGSEPSVRKSAQSWRDATVEFLRHFWSRMRDDGLLQPDADIDWLTETATVLSAAESSLLAVRSFGWHNKEYRDWLERTWTVLADNPPSVTAEN